MKNIRLLFIITAALMGFADLVSAQACNVNTSLLADKFSFHPAAKDTVIEVKRGEPFRQQIDIRLPKNSDEIRNSDIVSCRQYVPPGVDIKSIKVKKIENLPEGLVYDCDASGCTWEQKETGCMRISGKPDKPGSHDVRVIIEGSARVLFRNVTVECYMDGFKFVVD